MTRTDLQDLSVRTKVAGTLTIIFLLTVATIGGVGLYIQDQQHDARAINLAGQQRMLIQEMVKLSFMVDNGDEDKRDELLATARRYNRTLAALQEGAPERGIPPAPAPVQPQLRTIRSDWRPFYANIRTIAREPRTSEAFQDALNAVLNRQTTLVDETDEAVQLYEAAHERKIQTLTVFLGGMLVLDVAVMGLLLFFMSRRVISPHHPANRGRRRHRRWRRGPPSDDA